MTEDAVPKADASTGPATPSPRRWRGCLRGCLIVCAVFFLFPAALLAGAWFFRNRQMQSALDAEIAAARGRGEAISVTDLVAARPTSPEIERTTALWNEVVRELDEGHVFSYAHGRLEDLDRIRKGVDPFGTYDSEGCPFEPPADEAMSDEERYERTADGLLEHFRSTIDLAHEARRSGRDVAPDYPKVKYVNGLSLAHHRLADKPRSLMRLETARALETADRDRVREALLTAIAIIELVEGEPGGSMPMYGYAMLATWRSEALIPAIQSGILKDADLVQIQHALGRERTTEHLSAFGAQWRLLTIDSIRLRETAQKIVIDELKPPPRFEALNVDDTWKAYEISRRYREGATDPAAAMAVACELEKDVSESEFDYWRFFNSYENLLMLRVGVGSIIERSAYRRVCATAIACERYRLAHGNWPEKLEKLVPSYLDESPIDPFDDQPLRSATDAESIVVYSIGMDREDDGGIVDGGPDGDSAIRLPPEPKDKPAQETGAGTE